MKRSELKRHRRELIDAEKKRRREIEAAEAFRNRDPNAPLVDFSKLLTEYFSWEHIPDDRYVRLYNAMPESLKANEGVVRRLSAKYPGTSIRREDNFHLKRELKKREYFLQNVKKDDSWLGGALAIPFPTQDDIYRANWDATFRPKPKPLTKTQKRRRRKQLRKAGQPIPPELHPRYKCPNT